jgi:hypothetical protein
MYIQPTASGIENFHAIPPENRLSTGRRPFNSKKLLCVLSDGVRGDIDIN